MQERFELARRGQNLLQMCTDFVRAQHQINAAGLHGGHGHPVIFCAFGVLRDGNAARLANGLHPICAIRAGSGQNDSHGFFPVLFREAEQKTIDRGFWRRDLKAWLCQPELSTVVDKVRLWRGDVNNVGFKNCAVGYVFDLQTGLTRNQLRHQAFVVGRHMLHNHVSDIQICREGRYQFPYRFQPTGRRADSNNCERVFV